MEPKTQQEWIEMLKKEEVVVNYLPIQDILHVLKKLFNSLDSVANRALMAYPIDANIIRSKVHDDMMSDDILVKMTALLDSISFHRKDHMDEAGAVQRIISLAVQEMLVEQTPQDDTNR